MHSPGDGEWSRWDQIQAQIVDSEITWHVHESWLLCVRARVVVCMQTKPARIKNPRVLLLRLLCV